MSDVLHTNYVVINAFNIRFNLFIKLFLRYWIFCFFFWKKKIHRHSREFSEDTVPCPVKVKRPCPGRTANKEYCNRYGNGNGNGNENENVNGNGNGSGKNWRYNHCDPMIKQLCASPCCPAGKNRQNSDNSMYFLLHQGDAENVCRTNERLSPRPCGSPIMKKIEIPSPCSRFTRLW